MRYNISYNEGIIHESFSKGSVVTKAKDGSDVPVREYQGHTMPGTETVIGVLKDQNNVPCIAISHENLKKVVPSFAFYDAEKKESILDADPMLGIHPFWNHPDLKFEIKNFGQKLDVISYEATPKAAFWLDVFKADPRFWVNDGKTERPESLKEVQFIITPEGQEIKPVITKEFSEESYRMFSALNSMARLNKMFILDELGENLYHPIDTPDDELNIMIIKGISNQGEKRVYTGDTFSNFVTDVSKFDGRRLKLSKMIKEANNNNIIKYVGDNFYFENYSLGHSLKSVEEFLENPANKKISSALWVEIKNKGLYID